MAEQLLADRYQVEEDLGGTMGEVYLATDVELGRQVVVKLLRPDAERERFEREARAAASLAHPNIVNLYTYGETEGRPYMVLEYLPGGSLEDRLVEGRLLPDAETESVSRDIAAGLAHAHARGLVHRDLKPANILFDDEDRAKIADFGIARIADAGTLTEAGTLVGTAAYMSPEQAQGLPATPASDVYAFGVILFRMLTGVLPFTGPSTMELVAQHVNAVPPAVTDLRPDAPPHLAALADAALAKDPAARPHDGAALAAELNGNTAAASTVVMPAAAAASPPPRRRRRPVTTVLAVAALIVLVAGGLAAALALTQTSPSPTAPAGAATTSKTRHTTTSSTDATTSASTTTGSTSTESTTTAATQGTTQRATTVVTRTQPGTTTTATTAPTTTALTTTAATTTTPTTTTTPPP
jgi:eukaryotic-like serine/threonine-protein kinase